MTESMWVVKTKTRKPRKAVVVQEGNLFHLIPYKQFVNAMIAELVQTRGGRYA